MKPHQLNVFNKATKLVYDRKGPAKDGMWRGRRVLKYPTDLILYAELIFFHKPDFIIELGTRFGGGALFLADMCQLNRKGKVITVEIDEEYERPRHSRITSIIGDSTGDDVVNQVKELVGDAKSVMLILDSDHHPKHVMQEMVIYNDLCKKGDYMIVEDIYTENAYKAVNKFLKSNKSKFARDKDVEKYGIHCARDGFLVRI